MNLKKVILACASVLALSSPSRAQDINEFQKLLATSYASLENIKTARSYLQSQSLLTTEIEQDLGAATLKIQMAVFNLGQRLLPNLNYNDSRSRLFAFCDYNHEASLSWSRINRAIGQEQAQKPEWADLFKKARKDLPQPCD